MNNTQNLWIGGSPCAGKSTIARYLAHMDGSKVSRLFRFLTQPLMLPLVQETRVLSTGYAGHRCVHMSAGGFVYALATDPAKPTAVVRYGLADDLCEVRFSVFQIVYRL